MEHFKVNGPDGVVAVVHHNGDWSGQARIAWGVPKKHPSRFEFDPETRHETELPGWLLKSALMGAAYDDIRTKLMDFVEDLDPENG
jgi:hypothetical protein